MSRRLRLRDARPAMPSQLPVVCFVARMQRGFCLDGTVDLLLSCCLVRRRNKVDVVPGAALVAAPACGDSDLVLSDLAHEAMLVSG
jgi:hypothetical protein